MSIERFSMVRHDDHEHCGLESDPNGPYVTYRDHAARVAELEAARTAIQAALGDGIDESSWGSGEPWHQAACRLIREARFGFNQ